MEETFRDRVGVLEKDGERKWIYPKQVDGFFHRYRKIVSSFLLVLLFATPFVEWNGQPFMLFNVIERRFVLFGIPFFPQDFHIVALAFLAFVIGVVLFTVMFGRVFCGWICPQTIFLEFVFRRIEYWIEGDASKQRALDKVNWTSDKIFKKTLKHSLFFLISFFIANTFLAYLIGVQELALLIRETPLMHMGKFVSLLIFTAVFYLVFAKMRELACIVICPYGRLQGVLLDNNSMVVAYDFVRGEPRGKLNRKKETEETTRKGDCIDCKLCVEVCPTGIDIRNGTQLECVNCTACIDACDSIMRKVNKPKGLVRYASINTISSNNSFKITTRIWIYSSILVLLFVTVVGMTIFRSDVECSILRARGSLYQKTETNHITNLYNMEFVNKTFEDVDIELKLKGVEGKILLIGNAIKVPKLESYKGTFMIEVEGKLVKRNTIPIQIEVWAKGNKVDEVRTSFISPVEQP